MGALRCRVAAFTLVLVSTGAGCEALPDIRFVDDEAGAGDEAGNAGDSTTSPDSAGSVGDGEADSTSLPDSGDPGETGLPDASACPAPAPAGGVCCGGVWCLDQCDPANCDLCAHNGCAATEVCCGKNNSVVCKVKCP